MIRQIQLKDQGLDVAESNSCPAVRPTRIKMDIDTFFIGYIVNRWAANPY